LELIRTIENSAVEATPEAKALLDAVYATSHRARDVSERAFGRLATRSARPGRLVELEAPDVTQCCESRRQRRLYYPDSGATWSGESASPKTPSPLTSQDAPNAKRQMASAKKRRGQVSSTFASVSTK
jgi:hypothetical protein